MIIIAAIYLLFPPIVDVPQLSIRIYPDVSFLYRQ
jgi:hypothetical protein